MSLINISNLTFAYDGSYDNIFENVSFQIDTNWKLGFTGRNGRGKTTFLNLLLGKYEYSGCITSSVKFEYFPYEIANETNETQAIMSKIANGCEEWEFIRELALLKVDESVLTRPFNTLSNGEKTKVLLATLFLKENSFLLIDEPTNHLDACAREILAKYLKKKSSFILVSHDRSFLDSCVDHILSINKTDIEITKGSFSSWLINKERRDSFEIAENKKLVKEIGDLKHAQRTTKEWSDRVEATKIGQHAGDRGFIGHKSAKMMKRSKAIENRVDSAIERKTNLLKNIERSDDIKITALSYHNDLFVSLNKCSINYGSKPVCKDVTFSIERGDRIALKGRNGSGKSSIIKLILGENIPYTGVINIGSRLHISYVSQDTSDLLGDLSSYAKNYEIDESIFKSILRKLDFDKIQFDKDMSALSEGQKKKVLIARSLCEKAHLYLWDEPLNFIDVISRLQIEEMLQKHKPTILFVEHDAAFCDSIANKVVTI